MSEVRSLKVEVTFGTLLRGQFSPVFKMIENGNLWDMVNHATLFVIARDHDPAHRVIFEEIEEAR